MYKITKLKAVDSPQVATAESHDQYRESIISGMFKMGDDRLSPNVDYWVVGDILQSPSVGGFLIMDRWVRNGILTRGRFSTSEIVKIASDGFETKNSVYKMEKVSDEAILELTSVSVGV